GAVDLGVQIGAESPLRRPQEDLTLASLRILLPETRFTESAHECRVLEGSLQLFFRRHPPHQVHEEFPCFRRCVGGPHTYIIRAGNPTLRVSPGSALRFRCRDRSSAGRTSRWARAGCRRGVRSPSSRWG